MKMAENKYMEYRKKAAAFNERLSSRAGAAELLGISESSLAHYELDITKTVPQDVVVMMAEVYNAPELKNWYCSNECPIGKTCPRGATEEKNIEQVTIHLLSSMGDEVLKGISGQLLEIAEDGEITAEEAADLEPAQMILEKLAEAISELQILREKTRRRNEGENKTNRKA